MSQLLLLNTFIACGPKDAPVETATPVETPTRKYSEKPTPLEAPSFTLPQLERGELSNGIPVLVSNNNETPLVTVQIVFNAGEWNTQNPQVANAAMDMLTEGAGDYDAAGLSAEQRRLAASLSSYAGLDGSTIGLSSLVKNLWLDPQKFDQWRKLYIQRSEENLYSQIELLWGIWLRCHDRLELETMAYWNQSFTFIGMW